MKIDPRIEPLVRETLDAAVKSDDQRFGRALEAVTVNPATLGEALKLASAIVLAILHQQYDGGPNDAELEQIADEVNAHESWASLDRGEYLATLRAISTSRPDPKTEPRALAVGAFVIAAYLLAASTKKPKWWFEYLDEIEAILERQ